MTQIPEGYRVAVLAPDGTVLETIDLDGWSLGHPAEKTELAAQVQAAVNRAEA